MKNFFGISHANVKFGCGAVCRKKCATKAEQAVQLWLIAGGWRFKAQVTNFFELEGGGCYTPDFIAWKPGHAGLMVVEVKGGYKGPGAEQGIERYKRVAAQHDCDVFHFVMVTVDKHGGLQVDVWAAEDEKGAAPQG